MRICIVGAGISGLTIAIRLSQAGHQVDIFEASDRAGGLANGFKDNGWEWPLEMHYHHIFTSDTAIQKMADEIGVSYHFYRPKTSIWYKKTIHQFDSPLDVLAYPHLTFKSKLKLSAWLAYLKFLPLSKELENTTARQWLISRMGEEAWRVLWQPLFHGKFGQEADHVSAAWFWARIHKRSPKLGYFQGGFQSLADEMTNQVKKLGAQLHLNTPVLGIQTTKTSQLEVAIKGRAFKYDKVIVAGPSSLLLKIAQNIPRSYLEKVTQLRGIGAVNLVLALKQQFLTDHTYWLNINDIHMPFLAVVEHTNMIDPSHYNGDRLLYVGNYLPAGHQHFQLSETQLIEIFLPHLQVINPNFTKDWVRKSWVFKALFAQHIVTPHYREMLPSMQTPIPNLWWVSMQHVYPWDRGTNYAVEWGDKVAKMIEESTQD